MRGILMHDQTNRTKDKIILYNNILHYWQWYQGKESASEYKKVQVVRVIQTSYFRIFQRQNQT